MCIKEQQWWCFSFSFFWTEKGSFCDVEKLTHQSGERNSFFAGQRGELATSRSKTTYKVPNSSTFLPGENYRFMWMKYSRWSNSKNKMEEPWFAVEARLGIMFLTMSWSFRIGPVLVLKLWKMTYRRWCQNTVGTPVLRFLGSPTNISHSVLEFSTEV
jgi:hypothetical protein